MARWRLLDTGARSAARNIALDSVLLDLRSRDRIPSTLRFLAFSPQAVLVGRHQTVAQEVRLDYCRENGIEVNRRITGGGAVFFDSTQIGWEIVAKRSEIGGARMQDLNRIVCQGVIDGIQRLGIKASFRPRNDIEVNGRKLSGTGGAFDGPAFLMQGTLLVDFNAEAMIKALRIPTEKLSRRGIDSAHKRVICLADLLEQLPSNDAIKEALTAGISHSLNVRVSPGGLTAEEDDLVRRRLPHYESADWIDEISEPKVGSALLRSVHRGEGGLVRTSLSADLRRRRIKSVMFTGDFFISPARAVFDLEARLKDTRYSDAREDIRRFFTEEQPEGLLLGPEDFWQGLNGCLEKLSLLDRGFDLEEVNFLTTVGSSDIDEIASRATVMLLPYCAKLPECDLRATEGCDLCGKCTVGEAWEAAKTAGLLPVTVQSHKHLLNVFAACRKGGVTAYVGCCCQAFFTRRYRAFAASGLDGIIVDIADVTCYDLGQQARAYEGKYGNQTTLRIPLLEKVLALKPPADKRQSPSRATLMSVAGY